MGGACSLRSREETHYRLWVGKREGKSRTAPSAPHTRPTQRFSRPPPIQKLGAENHMLKLNI